MGRVLRSSVEGLFSSLVLTFLVARGALASDFDIVLSEIHYRPFGAGEPRLELVELHNRGASPVSLAGWTFIEGIDFRFPAGTFVDPGAYLVVAADAAALRAQHGGVTILGDFSGRLDNSGEILHLANASGQSISRVHFHDGGAWSSRADGKGPSLELLVMEGDIDRPQVWAPSLRFGGTPGVPNTRGREAFPYTGKDRASPVRLNEVKPGTGAPGSGHVEVWNGGAAALDASGYRVVSSSGLSGRLPAGSTIAAGGFLVVSGAALGFSPGSEAATYVLLKVDGVTMADALEAQAIASGYCSGRFPDGEEDGFVMPPSPGAPNAFVPDERVVVNEVFFAPLYEAPSGNCLEDCSDRHQWIELHNRSGSTVDLSGWSLERAVDLDFAPGTKIPSGGFLIVAAVRALFEKDHPGVAVAPGDWNGKLSSSEDTIILRDALRNVVDRIHYGNGDPFNDDDGDGRDDRTVTSSDWPTGVADSGRSIELSSPYLENAAGRAWRLGPAGGSPGARNVAFLDDPPPVIAHVTHFPPVPDPGTPVRVTCRAYAADAVQSVDLLWRIDGQAAANRVSMQDDGASGDGAAGDATFGALVPPQAHRTIVAFQISVTSASGKTDTYPPRPAQGQRTPYYLYEVDDDAPLDNGSVSYRVIMTRADSDALRNRAVGSDVLLNCTFIGDGEVHHMAAIRYRGENSRTLERKAYRVEFPPEDTFQGIESLNLNASNRVGSVETSSLRDFLSADLFRRAGLPYPQEWPVNLYFQRGVLGDLQGNANVDPFYVYKEHFNRSFLSRYFGASGGGNFYRCVDAGAGSGDLAYRGEDPADYARSYEKRSNRDENDYSDLVELCRAFDTGATPDAQFEDEMLRLIDVYEWAYFFALQDFLTNIDGGIQTNNGEDYFLYRVPYESTRPDAGLWLILPWDLEETFTDANTGLFITDVATVRRFLRHPAFAPLYLASLKDLRAGIASRQEMRPRYAYANDIYPAGVAASVVTAFDNYLARRLNLVGDQIVTGIQAAVLSSTAPGNKVISEGDSWSYFKGTREPAGGTLDWTFEDFDDAAWPRGPSGFGYGDNDDATVFDDMRQGGGDPGYLTAYVRKKFEIADLAAVSSLSIVVDYDDAFVAYLNGEEVARSAGLTGAGQVGESIPFDLEIGNAINHEASRGNNNPNPPETYPIGAWKSLIHAGTNVLAIQGFNSTRDSGDFSLIPELVSFGTVAFGGGGWGSELFVSGDTARLQGTADATAAVSLKVNGVLATLTSRPPGGGVPYGLVWRASIPVAPGTNRVRIEALSGPSGGGVVLAAVEVLVHRIDKGFTAADGPVSGAVTWTEAQGPYLVSSGLRVPAGSSLSIRPGTQVLLGSGASITVEGVLEATGTEAAPIALRPYSMTARWGGIQLARTGTGGADPIQRLSHVNIELGSSPAGASGCISARESKLLVEGCRFRLLSASAIDTRDGRLEVKDSAFDGNRSGVTGQGSVVVITGSSFRGMTGDSDAINLRGGGGERSRIAGCVIERSERDGIELTGTTADIARNTVRFVADRACFLNGDGPLGPSLVEGNVLHDAGTGLELRNGNEAANGSHNTIVSCEAGLRLSGDDQGQVNGQAAFHSLILWSTREDIVMSDRFDLALSWSDIGGSWPGTGNIAADPKFRDFHSGDFALTPGSPCAGAGKDGTDMGATGASALGVVFLRGDVTGEGVVNLTDGVATLNFLFRGIGTLACEDAADGDDSGTVNLTDVVHLLNYLFRGGPTVAPPYPEVGRDPTEDDLECE